MTWYNKNDVVIFKYKKSSLFFIPSLHYLFIIPSIHYLFNMIWYNKQIMSILKQIENQAFFFYKPTQPSP